MDDTANLKRSRGRPRNVAPDAAGGTVQALDRGILLLEALSRTDQATLTDLSLQIGLPPSTAHRLLMTLQKHGMVNFDDSSQNWSVGIEAFRIGAAFLKGTNLVEASRAAMHDLMEATGETANLGVPDSGDVVFVSQVESHNPIRAFFRPGTRAPMHSSGIGKALLAAMPRAGVETILRKKGLAAFTPKTLTVPDRLFADLAATRTRGWSFDDEERYTGMRCIASTIYNAHGEPAAGLSVSGPTVRLPDDAVAEIGPRVRRLAASLTRQIGGRVPKPVE